jgi:uncharacterized protein YqeY
MQTNTGQEFKMSVTDQIRRAALQMRKERDPLAGKLVFAISEIEKVGKNDGNRATTEDEAIKTIQKIIATIDQNQKLVDAGSAAAEDLARERQILESFLPQMASDAEVRDLLLTVIGDEKPKNKGIAMKVIRDEYGARVDMRRAGEIVTELYGI